MFVDLLDDKEYPYKIDIPKPTSSNFINYITKNFKYKDDYNFNMYKKYNKFLENGYFSLESELIFSSAIYFNRSEDALICKLYIKNA